jgi:lysophospholipase L1-like esterase
VVITVPQLAPIDGALVERITYAQLMERLSNPNSSKGDLAQYFLPDPEGSSAYAPGFKINPESVDMQGVREAVSDFLKPANYFCALRRRDACRQKIASGYDGLRLVSEGDSWFQYPFLLDDVIDNLSRDYAVYCIAAAGDVLQNMASPQNVDGEILPAIREINADGLLFSGGGNDIVGEILLKCLAEHNNAAEPLRYLTQEFDAQLAVIRKLYQSAFDAIFRRNPGLKIFTHGYDLPTPKPKGKWLGSYFEKRNIADTGLQRAIVKAMLGKVTDMHRHLAQLYDGRVFFVDCAGIVGDNAWYDELHPTNAGYTKVADRFRIAIGQAFPKRQGLRRIA